MDVTPPTPAPAGRAAPRSAPARRGAVRAGRAPAAARVRRTWIACAVLLGAAVVAGVGIGPAGVPAGRAVLDFVDRLPLIDIDSGLDARQSAILWELRLPRVVLGLIVGATLSLAGGAYQGVFRNPLADPYLLGAAAGAGLGATAGGAPQPGRSPGGRAVGAEEATPPGLPVTPTRLSVVAAAALGPAAAV